MNHNTHDWYKVRTFSTDGIVGTFQYAQDAIALADRLALQSTERYYVTDNKGEEVYKTFKRIS